MQITLTGKEFDSAIENYIKTLGFNTAKYSISTKTIVSRGESPVTTVVITLDEEEDKTTTPIWGKKNESFE
ncbi:MAG: hypothetical protein IE931_14685 [Sphingobacteriales bacterium]|nr:hypothetical protein [Sphingobacteriales bacterium]